MTENEDIIRKQHRIVAEALDDKIRCLEGELHNVEQEMTKELKTVQEKYRTPIIQIKEKIEDAKRVRANIDIAAKVKTEPAAETEIPCDPAQKNGTKHETHAPHSNHLPTGFTDKARERLQKKLSSPEFKSILIKDFAEEMGITDSNSSEYVLLWRLFIQTIEADPDEYEYYKDTARSGIRGLRRKD